MSIIDIVLVIGIVITNALFAATLVKLYEKQQRLEKSTARNLEIIYDMFSYQIEANDALDEDLAVLDEIDRNFAERLCDVENRLVDIELDLEDRDAQ